jgi:hypothetical protein
MSRSAAVGVVKTQARTKTLGYISRGVDPAANGNEGIEQMLN